MNPRIIPMNAIEMKMGKVPNCFKTPVESKEKYKRNEVTIMKRKLKKRMMYFLLKVSATWPEKSDTAMNGKASVKPIMPKANTSFVKA